MTNETTQLARCPFCGGEAECIEFDGYRPSSPKTYRVSCNDEDCTMQSAEYRTEEDAITAWNTRAESAELAALRQLRDDMQAGLTALENDNDRLRQQVTQLTAACVRAREAIRELIAADYDVAGDLQVIDAALKGADHE